MQQLFRLDGKVVLVTGASSGMGKAIALAMGAQGAVVIVSSKDAGACEEVVAELSVANVEAMALPCDMSRKEEIEHLAQKVLEKYERIDVLVSGVGVAPVGSSGTIETTHFEDVMKINVQNALYLTQLLLPSMVKRCDGVLIYLASIASVRGNKSIGLYGMSKAALVQMVRNIAVEYGPYNIRANAISPGMIDTPFSQSLMQNKAFMERRLALTPLRRVGTPEEIAGVVVMLASNAGGFITGQNIIVDGGTTISDGN
ncbi:SDR family NAD(P)-dependent oxidoreductase [Runella sp. SP2]|uniref:SDR family NAD(P)-dependent oxidoreductase n=1 Tax=Runella sp. SP2 TaxID=2268026 RepID=UPI000F097128|nr:SDR family oxidoreductase [Runella sp. SP2]AYQ36276.1 SDR family NAD(P)-dependent oxidoreductase [Runella sp. SP2]